MLRVTARVVLPLLLLAGCAAVGPGATAQPQARDLANVHGAIIEVNAAQGWFGIVPDGDKGTRYAPDKLPEEFRKNGLRVVFSGSVGAIDPNVRAWGTPLALTEIHRE